MLHSLRRVVVGVVAIGVALLVGCPMASAAPWDTCGPHSLEDKVVRVFPRTPSTHGPTGSSSALPCGSRYYGVRRMEAEWTGMSGADWRAAADAAIAHTLATDATPVHDARSNTWTFDAPGAVVVTGPHGLVLDAHPNGH